MTIRNEIIEDGKNKLLDESRRGATILRQRVDRSVNVDTCIIN